MASQIETLIARLQKFPYKELFPGVPEPQADPDSLYATVAALKQGFEHLTRARGNMGVSAVMVKELQTLLAEFESYLNDKYQLDSPSGGGSGDCECSWEDLEDKPDTFPPEDHTHEWEDINNPPTSFPPGPHNHRWDQIVDKPSTFPPDPHTHDHNSEITGRDQPDAHPMSAITGLEAEQDAQDAAIQQVADDLASHEGDFTNPHQVLHDQLTDVSPDQHHAQSHSHDGLDGSGRVSHTDLLDITPDDHHNRQHDHSDPLDGTVSHTVLSDITPDDHHNQQHDHTDPADGLISHTALQDITPDDHHDELHTLGSHTDVNLDNVPLKEGHGIWYDADTGTWKNRVGSYEVWPTGLANGGELNIGPGVNDIEVIAGLGAVTNSYTDPLSPPTIQGLSWDQINTPITAAPAVAGSVVWFSISDTGVPATPPEQGGISINQGQLNQYTAPPSPSLARQEIFLGVAVHNGTEWKEISNPKVLNQSAETLRELLVNVLPLTHIISGGEVTEAAAFTLNQATGVLWENNRNWHVDKSNPNRETLPAAAPISFQYVNGDFSDVGTPTSTVNPSQYTPAPGTGAPTNVGGGSARTTIQRLYLDPANNYWMLWGQNVYSSFFAALANLESDLANTTVPFILQNSILLGSIVSERSKSDWDVDESVFIPGTGGGGQSGGGGTPITEHNNLTGIGPDDHHFRAHDHSDPLDGVVSHTVLADITPDDHHNRQHDHSDPLDGTIVHGVIADVGPDDHHNQVHKLYGADHSDVNIVPTPEMRHLLQYNQTTGEWEVDYRVRATTFVDGNTYYPQEMVYEDGYLSIANKVTTDVPYPLLQGIAEYTYGGIAPTASVTAKQVIFGQRYKSPIDKAYQLTRYRINTVTGNTYRVFFVLDPETNPVFTELGLFTANSTGWVEFNQVPLLIPSDTHFDLVAIADEPDPSPTVFSGNWDYNKPNNPGTPGAGDISHANKQADSLRVHKTDNDGGDRSTELATMEVGDIIEIQGGTRWAIQAIIDNGTWYDFTVAPSQQDSASGVNQFNFETTVATPITRMEDVNWWGLNPPLTGGEVEGLYIEDGQWGDIVPNTNAYGTDVFIQELVQSPDWDLYGIPGGAGGGGGAFTPDLFTGPGTSGYVPDPVTGSGRVLEDSGNWITLPSGVTDHGQLNGLGDDDHPQYHTDARGDARYPAIADYNAHVGDTNIHWADAPDASLYFRSNGLWTAYTPPVSGDYDHGLLQGLGDDDHPQYHTDARGDVRYYLRAEVDASQAVQDGRLDDLESGASIPDLYVKKAGDTMSGQLTVDKSTGIHMTLEDTSNGANVIMEIKRAAARTRLQQSGSNSQWTYSADSVTTNSQIRLSANSIGLYPASNTEAFRVTSANFYPLASGYDIGRSGNPFDVVYATSFNEGGVNINTLYADKPTTDAHIADASIHFEDVTAAGQYFRTNTGWVEYTPPTVITDHGALGGLGDDDHPQYHNDTRGDARYYTQAQVDSSQAVQDGRLDALEALPAPVTDHGGLTGLGDDDHTQYHNNTRGDARYYQKAEVDAKLGVSADLGNVLVDALGDNKPYWDGDYNDLINVPSIVNDHGGLSGLTNDDHPQYHTDARGDARYSQLGHTHPWGDITGKPSSYPPDPHSHTESDIVDLKNYVEVAGDTMTGRLDLNNTGSSEQLRLRNDAGYISFYDTANTSRKGYLQGTGTILRLIADTGNQLQLRTVGPEEMLFYTNGTSRMRITSDGHVRPEGNLTNDFGLSSRYWRNIYAGDFFDDGVNINTLYAPISHTHVEADITDLDKYTQAEVDALIAGVDPSGDYLPLTGGTLTGNLDVALASGQAILAAYSNDGANTAQLRLRGFGKQGRVSRGNSATQLMHYSDDGVTIETQVLLYDTDIRFRSGGGNTDVMRLTGGQLRPHTDALLNLGSTTYNWDNVYTKTLYENNVALSAKYAPIVHTHTESDITDLDKYTQAEVDALIAGVDPTGDYVQITGDTMTGDLTVQRVGLQTTINIGDEATANSSRLIVRAYDAEARFTKQNGYTDILNYDTLGAWQGRIQLYNSSIRFHVDQAEKVRINPTNFRAFVNEAMDLGLSSVQWNGVYGKTFYENNVALSAKYAPIVHTHVEADITDLDKYTQAEVDALIAGAGGGTTESEVTQNGHGFAVLDCIRWNGSSWVKAQANDVNTTALGVVIEVVNANTFKYAITGRYDVGSHGLTTDEWYFLSDATAGDLTATPPAIEQPIVYVETSTVISVYAYRPTEGDIASIWSTDGDDIYNANAGAVLVNKTAPSGSTTKFEVDAAAFGIARFRRTGASTTQAGGIVLDTDLNNGVALGGGDEGLRFNAVNAGSFSGALATMDRNGIWKGLVSDNGASNPNSHIMVLTQAQYDAIGTKDANTIYVITA